MPATASIRGAGPGHHCLQGVRTLQAAGYVAQNASTRALIGRWRAAPAQACLESKSVDYLRRTRQLEFTLDDDEALATGSP